MYLAFQTWERLNLNSLRLAKAQVGRIWVSPGYGCLWPHSASSAMRSMSSTGRLVRGCSLGVLCDMLECSVMRWTPMENVEAAVGICAPRKKSAERRASSLDAGRADGAKNTCGRAPGIEGLGLLTDCQPCLLQKPRLKPRSLWLIWRQSVKFSSPKAARTRGVNSGLLRNGPYNQEYKIIESKELIY